MNADRWFHALVVCWLLVIGGISRWSGLINFAFSPDDVLILGIAQSETLAELFENSAREVHPPLFYLVLRMVAAISTWEPYLRAAMMAIGLLSIPVVYFTGVRFVGKVGAVAMGLIASLSLGAVLETPTLRHYSLVILLSSVGWFLFLWYRESKKSSVLYGYALVVLLGILTHYSQLLLFGAIGLTHFIVLLSKRDTRRHAGRFLVVHIPAILAALYLVLTHVLRQWMGEGHYNYIVNRAYAMLFPHDAATWYQGFMDLGHWLSMPNFGGTVAIVLAFLGLVVMSSRSGLGLLSVILCVVGFQVIGTAVRAYPLGASRHCLYLLPLFAFAFGSGMGALVEWVMRRLEKNESPVISNVTSLILLVGVSVPCGYAYVDNLGYRLTSHAHTSYPVFRLDYHELIGKLHEHLRPGRSFITNRQSSMYLRHATKNISGTHVFDVIYKVSYRGADFFYLDDRSVAHTSDALMVLVEAVAKADGSPPTQPMYLFNVGWGQGSIRSLATNPNLGPDELLVSNESCAFVRIRLDKLRSLNR